MINVNIKRIETNITVIILNISPNDCGIIRANVPNITIIINIMHVMEHTCIALYILSSISCINSM